MNAPDGITMREGLVVVVVDRDDGDDRDQGDDADSGW